MRDYHINKWLMLSPVILIVVTTVLSGCGITKKNITTVTQSYPNLNQPHPTVRTGDINTGNKVPETTQSIDSSGGMLSISKPGDPMNGFVIDVPSNSYSGNTTFNVSSAPITGQTFGSDIDPISPMIYVDNGGVESNELMYIRVPVTVPAGDFAMGFIYDATTKQLEGMPLIATDPDSIIVGTRHFSNFFISMISETLLNTDIDSGFRPGVDDWQFTNYGSYITQGGECEGQSLTALWYYCTQPEGTNFRLYGRYDNNGEQPATPDFWYDDSLGYRFASVAQNAINNDTFANQLWLRLGGKDIVDINGIWHVVSTANGIGDETTRNLFAYSILATKEPQLVCIFNLGGDGHAMIVYRIYQGNLYVADPNYPGNTERVINYANGKFQPYNSGANASEIAKGHGTSYNEIAYYAKSTVLPYDQIAQLWAQFKNDTIGNDKFPPYQIVYKDSNGKLQPLRDGYMSDSKYIYVWVTSNDPKVTFGVFRDGDILTASSTDGYELQPGTNKLGIYVMSIVQKADEFIDFKYITVYNSESATPSAARPSMLTLYLTPAGQWDTTGETLDLPSGYYATGDDNSSFQIKEEPITWNGNSFSLMPISPTDRAAQDKDWANQGKEWSGQGTLSQDGKTLTKLDVTLNFSEQKYDPNSNAGPLESWTYHFSVTNMPLTVESYGLDATLKSTQLAGHCSLTETGTISGGSASFVPEWSDPSSSLTIALQN
jgi:hypothetical protein